MSRFSSVFVAGICLALLGGAGSAAARVENFALVVGNNHGASDEPRLKFAQADAERMATVFIELGGVPAENLVLLKEQPAAVARRALIGLNDRIRSAASSGAQAVLLVYYSGHADENSLHLGESQLDIQELNHLVRGSAAAFRVLIVDACRSGTVTRVKGGTAAPPFPVLLRERLTSEGAIFLSASTAGEAAQESEELKGSFFTHYLHSGLLGAADADGDGQVVVEEAYRYAYENTLRASSRTLSGAQHPTFQYDLRGQGKVVLSMPRLHAAERAAVAFPPGRTYLLLQDSEDGAVVAEVNSFDVQRRLSIRPGRYFVRARSREGLLEGYVQVVAGREHTVSEAGMVLTPYVRLARKGGVEGWVRGPALAGYRLRTAFWKGASPCGGPFVGFNLFNGPLNLSPRVGACRGGFENTYLTASNDELDGELRVTYAKQLGRLRAELGPSLGVSVLNQRFETRGVAPTRTSVAGQVSVVSGLAYELDSGFSLGMDVAAQTYLFRQAAEEGKVAPAFSGRGALFAGYRW